MKGRSLYPAAVVIGVGAALIGTAEVATADIGTDAEVANAGVSHPAAVSAGPRKSTGRAFRVATVAEAPPARRGRVVRPSARSAATVVVARAASQSARATGTSRVNPIAALLFNKTPTLAPVAIGQDSAGVVTGDLRAADSDGGTVSFVVTRGPVNGTVVVDTTGRYTYTPDPEYAQAGTTDSFTVSVSDADAGFHLHGLVGLLNLLSFGLIGQSGHSATATVPVVVYPTGPPPNPPSVERRVYATATDSTITVTPESGEAAHVIINPSPIVAPKGQLVVFLPGTQGVPEQYTLILRAAAGWGFHAIGLNYPNQTAVGALCGNSSDADCFWNARTEILFGDGTPVNGQADITMADSIVNRLDKLLLSMNATHPAEGWGQFLLADNTVDWGKVVLAGHSQGGGHVGVMAKTVSLGRAVYFSSPADWNNLTDQPADWTVSRPTATPASRQYGFGSDSDPLVPNEKAFAIWDNLGLAEPATGPVLVDTASDAYSGSHQLRTALTYNPASTAPGTALKNHGITVVDVSTPVDGSGRPVFGTNGVWAYLLG